MANDGRTLLILDLDETLIHATECELERCVDFRTGLYYVYRRPYLNDFLSETSKAYDIAIWSSGTSDYVREVVNTIMPDELKLVFVWGRDRCTRRYDAEWQEEYFVKNLKKVKRLGYDLDRVLIVEDTPKKVEGNYGNAVYISSYFGAEDDRELLDLTRYLNSICDASNVRCIEKRGWRNRPRGSV